MWMAAVAPGPLLASPPRSAFAGFARSARRGRRGHAASREPGETKHTCVSLSKHTINKGTLSVSVTVCVSTVVSRVTRLCVFLKTREECISLIHSCGCGCRLIVNGLMCLLCVCLTQKCFYHVDLLF